VNEPQLWFYLLVFLSSITLSGLSVPILRKIAFKFAVLDNPNQSHKTHKEPIPYLGGFSIVLPVLILCAVGPTVFSLSQETVLQGITLILPCIFISLVGLIDDIRNLAAPTRFLTQLAASALVSLFLIENKFLVQITGIPLLNFLISIFWIVGITNAINLVDNLDGAAAGLTAIACLSIFTMSLLSNQFLLATFSLTIGSAALGFLFWNRNPAKIYLGDSGSLFLGLALSVILIQFNPSVQVPSSALVIPIFIMAIPIIDTSVVVMSRIIRGVSIFQGGRDHISHRIIARGVSRKSSVILICSLGGFFSSLALVINQIRSQLIEVLPLVGLLSMATLILIFLRMPILK
jgi:UDP-GlcNAc:undecaprenyl-phosphate GlcNAc-1-phosphate transferase